MNKETIFNSFLFMHLLVIAFLLLFIYISLLFDYTFRALFSLYIVTYIYYEYGSMSSFVRTYFTTSE